METYGDVCRYLYKPHIKQMDSMSFFTMFFRLLFYIFIPFFKILYFHQLFIKLYAKAHHLRGVKKNIGRTNTYWYLLRSI